MRHNTVLVIPLIAVLMLSFGVIFEPQNAYAGIPEVDCSEGETSLKAPPVVTSIVPTSDGAVVDWTQAELDVDISFFFFSFHLLCAFPHHFEIEVTTSLPVLGPFLFEDDTIPGGDSGTYTLTDLDCGTTYFFDIDGLWRTPFFSETFLGGFHIDGADETFTTLPCGGSGGGVVGHFVNNQQPSIGITESGKRVVDGGITVTTGTISKTVDADFFHTPFPLIQAEIGQPIDFVFVIWDDRLDNIKQLQVEFGKGKVGESFTMEHSAIWKRDVMSGVVTVTHDPMFKDVIMEKIADKPCRTGSTNCTVIHVRLTPTQAIVGDVVFGVNIWDQAGNAVTTFFNDGIQFGTEEDVIDEEPTSTVVVKKQLRTNDGWGNIDKRYSEAFAMKLAWHNEQVQKKVIELGYVF